MKKKITKITAILCALALVASVFIALPLTVAAGTVNVTVNNNGYISTLSVAAGNEIPEPAYDDELDFLGWYSDVDLTVPFGAVKENESRTAYAKYNKTVITFENKSDYVFDVTYRDDADSCDYAFTSGVITDPDDANNKVFKLHSPNIYANLCLPKYDASGAGNYKLDSNDTYVITARFKIPDSVTVSSFQLRLNIGDASTTIGSYTAGRTAIESSTQTYSVVKTATGAANEVVPGQWYTYTYTGSFGDTSKKTTPQIAAYFKGSYNGDFGSKNYIYFDDVTVYNLTDNTGTDNNSYTGFENSTISYSDGMNSSTAATISTDEARNGKKSLKIATGGSAYYKSYVYNGNKTAISVERYNRYEVTFYYKVTNLKSNAVIKLDLHNNDNVWGSGAVNVEAFTVKSATDGWVKHTFAFYSANSSTYRNLGIGVEGAASGDLFYFDDFTVTKIGDYNYRCDFDADFTEYPRSVNGSVVDGNGVITNSSTNGTHPNYYSSHVAWKIDNGVLSYPTNHSSNSPSTTSAQWVQIFALKDKNTLNPNFKLVSGETYHITIRYKQTTETGSATGRFSVASKTPALNESKAVQSIWINNIEGSTDWQTYTFSFTCTSAHANKYLILTMGSSSGTTVFDIDYVAVQTGVKLNNNGNISFNHDVTAGQALPEPDHEDDLKFIGWYSNSSCTTEFGKVGANETRTAYAKYNKTVITFETKGYTSYRSFDGYSSGIVTDPTNSSNNVYKMACSKAWGNVVLANYDANDATEYVLEQGAEYTVEFKFMLPEAVTGDADNITLRLLNGPSTVSGNAIMYSTVCSYKTSEMQANKWYTYTVTFTASDLSKGKFLKISAGCDSTTNKDLDDFVYIDDVKIFNSSDYATVTFNDNGVIYTQDLLVGQEPDALNSTDEQVFLGWFADADFTTAFGSVQKGETRIAYAKYDNTKIAFNNVGFTDSTNNVSYVNDPANAENKVVKIEAGTNIQTVTLPNYDAAGAGAFKVKSGTTYVVRFKLKTNTPCNGYVSIMGNQFAFDGNDASWTVSAIAFTPDSDGTLTMNFAAESAVTVYIDNLYIYTVTETPSTTVTSGNSSITATAPTAKNNRLTGVISVNLANGEQIKINGIKITYDIYATAFSETVTRNIFTSVGGYDDDRDSNAGDGLKYIYSIPANAKNVKITAEFTSDSKDNLGIIASSIREKTDTYSTGIRFRGRVYKTNGIKNVGFIITPKKFIPEGVSLTLDNAAEYNAVIAVATDTLYDFSDTYHDYQVLLKGDNMEKLKDVDMHCVIYVEYEDGGIYYGVPKTTSYDSVYNCVNQTVYGITSYYGAEYKDTRDKLLSSQSAEGFSFIMLTDTHIDYSFTFSEKKD